MVSHFHPSFSVSKSELSLELSNSAINRITYPSLADPTTADQNDTFKIYFQTNISDDPIEVIFVDGFLQYSTPIQSTVDSIDGGKVSTLQIPDGIEPSTYDLRLIFPNETSIDSFNSLKISRDSKSDECSSYSFVHITDIHIDGSESRKNQVFNLFNEINLVNPDFVVLTGDVVDGLTSDQDGNMVTAKTQYPQAVELIKTLEVPVLIINGNHDFQTNKWQDGNLLWEDYFGSLSKITSFLYQKDLFVGVNLFDANGLTNDQLEKIDEIFQNSSSLKIFFAHTDYQNQFPSLYTRNNVDIALLGHEHASSTHNVSGTLEIITDNGVTLIETEPGHYKQISISQEKEIKIQEYEVNNLLSYSEVDEINNSALQIEITLRNNHNFLLENITKKMILPGNWTQNVIFGAVDNNLLFNGTHTKLTTKFNLDPKTETNFSLILTSSPSENHWNSTKTTIGVVTYTTETTKPITTTQEKIGVNSLDMFIITLFVFTLILMFRRRKKKN